jgi:biotin carboxylase
MSATAASEAPSGRVLLLIPTTSYKAHDFLAAADRLGLTVSVGSDQPQVLEAFSQGGSVTVDFQDRARGLGQILDHAAAYSLAAVLGVEDVTVCLAAEAAAALGLPHNPPEAARRSVDKLASRQALAAAGLPVPSFCLLEPEDDRARAAREVSYPCVLKPLGLSASRGVIRADDPVSFQAAATRITEIAGEGPILVESFIPGREVALEGLLDGGRLQVLALFDKPDPLDGPYFEETLYVTPSSLPAATQAEVRRLAQATATALGLEEGPVHGEFRINDEGVWPLEMAARTIGGLCARSLRFATGAGLEEIVLRHALGRPLTAGGPAEGASGVLMIPIPRPGRLRAVAGQAAARELEGIKEVTITIPLGQEVVPLPEGDKYLGFIFARAEGPEAVEAALRAAQDRLEIRIE